MALWANLVGRFHQQRLLCLRTSPLNIKPKSLKCKNVVFKLNWKPLRLSGQWLVVLINLTWPLLPFSFKYCLIDDLTVEYWSTQAERRRLALTDALEENQQLHEEVDALKTELDSLKEENQLLKPLAEEAQYLAGVIKVTTSQIQSLKVKWLIYEILESSRRRWCWRGGSKRLWSPNSVRVLFPS